MASNALTFEEIDQHINTHSKAAPTGAKAAGAAAIPNVCAQYKVIRPILIALESFPFIPQKWRDALKAFTSVMDTFCP